MLLDRIIEILRILRIRAIQEQDLEAQEALRSAILRLGAELEHWEQQKRVRDSGGHLPMGDF